MASTRRGRTAHLTKSFVDGLTPEGLAEPGTAPRDVVIWDERQPGFCVKVKASGHKTFWAVGRARGARNPSWIKIGVAAGQYDVQKLRGEAADFLTKLRGGEDPNAQLRKARTARTLDELSVAYFAAVEAKLKPKTLTGYKGHWENELKPKFGSTVVRDIRHEEIAKWHAGIAADRPYLANRALALLRAMLNRAERFGDLKPGANPCRGVSLAREQSRERFLDQEERQRLDVALQDAEAAGLVYPVAAIRLLAATGARRDEILDLRWSWVSLERGLIELPDSKTGGKPIILSKAAVAILQRIPRQADNPFVIVGRLKGARLTDLEKPWRSIRKAADLADVRLHDLRHSYASQAILNGVPLTIVGKLLGHRNVRTTQKYAHVADAALREAAELATTPVKQRRVVRHKRRAAGDGKSRA